MGHPLTHARGGHGYGGLSELGAQADKPVIQCQRNRSSTHGETHKPWRKKKGRESARSNQCITYRAFPPPMIAPVSKVRLPHTTRSLRFAAEAPNALVPELWGIKERKETGENSGG